MLSARATPVELVRTVAVGVALVLVSAVTTALSAEAEPAAQAQVRGRLPALVAFVEAQRGLRMRRGVRVEVLEDRAFRAALAEPTGEPEPAGGDQDATLQALGLTPPGTTPVDDAEQSSDAGVVGFYDPATERLAVRADRVDPYAELVLVHELTHALQDQWFGINRPELDSDSERALGFDALVEGDATLVEQAWLAAQSPAVRRAVRDEEVRRFGEGPPIGLQDPLEGAQAFPYVAGVRLAEALVARGGTRRLDAAYVVPPVSTEQVLHPDLVGRDDRVFPPRPDPGGGQVLDEGVLGELGLAQLLGRDARGGGPQVGWEGDAYVTVRDSRGTCTLATVVMADTAARDRLVGALRTAGFGARSRDAATLELSRCS